MNKTKIYDLIALLREDIVNNTNKDGTTQLKASYLFDITNKIMEAVTEAPNKKIRIPLSDNDLQDLQGGETFDWTFDGVDVHLYQTNEDTE